VNESRFVRWAGVVGDLGSPFLAEERQRDVWNEASAVGLQASIWLTMSVSAGSLWIGGASALPYSLAMVATMAAASVITLRYAEHLGVRTVSRKWLSKRRLVLSWVTSLVFAGGMVRAVWGYPSFRNGMVVGLCVGLALSAVLALRALRAADRAERAEAVADDVP
jgi:hypothetical protein